MESQIAAFIPIINIHIDFNWNFVLINNGLFSSCTLR